MRVYLDTSLLVSALTNEARSAEVLSWLARLDDALLISGWTLTEFASALALKRRARTITDAEWRASTDALVLLAENDFEHVNILAVDFSRAAALAGRSDVNLRGGDALHLAIAERNDATLCTLDKGQATAGAALNIKVQLL